MFLLIYLLIVNLIGFIICYVDKEKAKAGKWRIPEKTLFIIAFIGGGVGLYGGFKVFHHKTLHKRFMVGVPLIVLLQVGLLLWWYL